MENNFGVINAIFLQNAERLLKTKSGKQLVKEYVNKIKGSKDLSKQYGLYEFIENQVNSENIKEYINEAVGLCSNVNKKKLVSETKELANLLAKGGVELNESVVEQKYLYENIDKLIKCGKSLKSVNEKVDSINNIVEHIKTKTIVNEIKCDNKQLITNESMAYVVGKFNNKYKNALNETDLKLFESLTTSDEVKKVELYIEKKNECLTLTNETLKEDIDNTTREKLLSVKEALLNENYDKDMFIEDMLRFIDLKETLED